MFCCFCNWTSGCFLATLKKNKSNWIIDLITHYYSIILLHFDSTYSEQLTASFNTFLINTNWWLQLFFQHYELLLYFQAVPRLGRSPAPRRGDLSISGQRASDLWWKVWEQACFFVSELRFRSSASLHYTNVHIYLFLYHRRYTRDVDIYTSRQCCNL